MYNIHPHSHPKILSDTYNSSSSILSLLQYIQKISKKYSTIIVTFGYQWFSIPSLHNKPKVGLNTQIFTFLWSVTTEEVDGQWSWNVDQW